MARIESNPVLWLGLVVLELFANFVSSEDLLLNLNPKKVIAVTSDKFLSLTIDPAVLLTGDVLTSSTELSTNMAKALAPGYVRLAGPRSNSFTFERSLFPQNGYEDPDHTFSEAHWVLVQQWAQRSGLDVVSTLNPKRIENEDKVSSWDPRNSLDLISFSDHMGYNISWQLGYECQTRCDVTGGDLGKDVARLRHMLGAFPRYTNSIIAGPDFVSFKGRQQQQFIQDYLNGAGNALSVITWHPDFAGIALDSDGVALQVDTLAADKDLLYKSMGRTVAKKPLWIAESKPEECKRQFLGALVWARRLGSAAKLGVQVIMRQPDASNLFQPTPDYWVSLLHKMLVGREVLDAKLTSGNKTHVHFYCQCTKPSAKYDRGAITIFGINLTPGKVSVALKGLKIKAVHKYILMPGFDTDNRMFAETVLLNNEPLNLENGKNLPEINPAVSIMGKNMAIKLPSGGIGFWVIPGARVKLCMVHDEEPADKNLLLKKLSKKLEEPETDENVGHESDDEAQDLDADSAEDIKSILKAKKKWRRNRHSDEAEEEERKFKRIDTKKELEKLEKLLKRNNPEEKKPSHFKGRVGLSAMFESDENKEEDNSSEEDDGLVRLKNDRTDSGEDIRAKLKEYKDKLIEYEARQKKESKKDGFPTDVDTQKALEALALISKVENSGDPGTSRFSLANRREVDLATDIGEEMLIEELERSDKTKRMIDPKAFGTLYQMLMSGQDKVDAKPREKRDLEKLLNDDPLGLRKEGLFKKRLKADEAKERRLERRMRKKEKDDIVGKKELSIPRITADSSENNFFGFPQMKPLPNFPKGDLFLSEGHSEEDKDNDYDYVKDDDEDKDGQMQRKRGKGKGRQRKNGMEDEDQTWVEEPGANSPPTQVPREFFERLNHPKVKIQTQWKGYDELYEPESLMQREVKEEDHEGEVVVAKNHSDERDDKRAKETAVKKLKSYYDNSEVLKTEPITEVSKPKEKKRVRIQAHFSQTPKKEVEEDKKKKFEVSEEEVEDSMEFVHSKSVEDYSEDDYVEEEAAPKKRPKRKSLQDYEMFRKEMIREDAGNLKDCKCRVIRSSGRLECKDCKKSRRRRPRRDLADHEATENVDSTTEINQSVENKEPEASQEGNLQDLNEEVVASEKNIETEDQGDDVVVQEELIPESSTAEPTTSNFEDTEPPETVAKEPADDVVGSTLQINEEEPANLEEIVDDKKKLEIPEASEVENLEEKFNTARAVEEGGEKIEIPVPSEDETVGSTAVETKSKSGLDLKLKTGKSKFALNTEALSTLIKESENRKADVMKAFETSAKLKSNENSKYVEYQKKRAEKLSSLKEKLKERKAKVLQQYRQELVDALNKCDDEMERNIKRREILEDLSELEEFQDFVDKDKLAYVMMNRPVNYEAKILEEDDDPITDGKYYPKIDMTQPLRSPREQRVTSKESKRYFQVPRRNLVYSTPEESLESSDNGERSYYAIVESLENPKIISTKHFRVFKDDGDSDRIDSGLMHKKHRHHDEYDHQDALVHHRQYPKPVYPENRIFEREQYSKNDAKELEELIPISENLDIVRRQREVREKQPSYICLKADSAEDLVDDENRLFRLIRSDDHFEAMPISGFPEDLGPRRQRRVDRRVLRDDKKRHRHPTDYRLIEDEVNRLESSPGLSPEEYELLMLIPLKKNKAKRHRRDLDNSIDRMQNYEDMNEVWGDIVDVKEGEDRLQEYLDEKEKTVRDFEETQKNVSEYLKKLEGLQDPGQLETFDKFILNLGAPEQEEIAVAGQDDLDRIHLGEYLKQEILKQVHGGGPTTPAVTLSLFEETMPKLEGVINGELEKVEKLTESFEDFIDEFDQKFDMEDEKTEVKVPEEKKKISHNVFQKALENVKKFFDFLTGVVRIFHRH